MVRRALPWVLFLIAAIAGGATYVELEKARDRYDQLAGYRSRNHQHFEVREFIIRAKLIDAGSGPIVVFGDSITEMARLPEFVDRRRLINAGIGGAATRDLKDLARQLLEDRKPSLVVVALGSNDSVETLRRDYRSFISELKKLAPALLIVGVPQIGTEQKNAEIKAAATNEGVRFIDIRSQREGLMPDGIHLNDHGYQTWIPILIAAIVEVAS